MTSKIEALSDWLRPFDKVAVALSGGLDSSVLLAFCADKLGAKNCIAFLAKTPYMPASEQIRAHAVCRKLGVACVVFESETPSSIAQNPPERCYLCKKALFSILKGALSTHRAQVLLDGTNADDTRDYRPGMRALKELGIRSPFLECGIGKSEIRKLHTDYFPEYASHIPAPNACLLTRLPHGMKIDAALLERIDRAEDFLREKGFECVRVRIDHEGARIEIEPEKISVFSDPALTQNIVRRFKELGFDRLCLDLEGYRRGSMNAVSHL